MQKIIKQFQSPYFINEKRNILIIEPKNMTKNTPVLCFLDGQILKLNEKEFNQYKGIDILEHLKKLDDFILIAINSMNNNDFFKYKKRTKELMHQDKTGKYLFFNKIKQEILKLKSKYKGVWFGFGFSLSGFLLAKHKSIFDYTILISPYFFQTNLKLSQNSTIFYGKKEYKSFSNKKINKPIQKIKELNNNINVIEIKNMKHTFPSWNNNFPFILENSVFHYIFNN